MLLNRVPVATAIALLIFLSTQISAQVNLSCPAAMTVKTSQAGVGHCSVAASWKHPEAANCDRSALLELSLDENAPQVVRQGGKFTASALEVGVHQIKYAIAKGDQVQTCATTVTVVDDEAPVVHNCPTEITLPLQPGGKCIMPDLLKSVTVTDNCDGIETTQYPEPGVFAGKDGDVIQGFIIASAYFHSASTTCEFSIRLSSPALAYQDVAAVEDCSEECDEFPAAFQPSTSASTAVEPK